MVDMSDPNRRRKVLESTTHNGIDYLEVDPLDQRTLLVHFLHPLPGQAGGIPDSPALEARHVLVDGGERITGIVTTRAEAAAEVLTVTVDRAGDFSTYRLRLVAGGSVTGPPGGFDPQLSTVDFSFKVTCASPFDCAPGEPAPGPVPASPPINYLAKDYEGFRALMLDRIGTLLPGWTDRSPADPMIAVVEALAHELDKQSYFQDAIGTEAYLGTARSRVAVRRHARLLDYAVHEGCNARCWVAVDVEPGSDSDGIVLPARTPVLPGRPGEAATVAAPTDDPLTFETMHPLPLVAARSRIALHTWSAEEYVVGEGSTTASLVGGAPLGLGPGDVLVLEETAGPATGAAADADPAHRQAVRLTSVRATVDPIEGVDVLEIAWHHADALRFDLVVAASPVPGAPPMTMAVARGNVVLADHGRRVQVVLPAIVDDRYRPVLAAGPITCAEPYPASTARTRPAADAERRSAAGAVPVVTVIEGEETWSARRDLLASGRFDRHFVVETETGGTSLLRFGDDTYGRVPTAGNEFVADLRIGNGPAADVGRDTLRRVVWHLDGITGVTNPLAGFGGTAPESMAEVRQFAPEAFRVQRRAVTEADWAEVARRHPEVLDARARFRWTGSWYTVYLTLDRAGGASVTGDPAFLADVRAHLERFRISGYDLEITDPIAVAVELALHVCVEPGFFRADVHQALLAAFGRHAFFSPDNFSFGTPLYLSDVYRAAMAVPGVAFVEITRCRRLGRTDAGEIAQGYVKAADLEVIRLDNDPSFPERGTLELVVEGGR